MSSSALVALDGVTLQLPDGSTLFNELSLRLDRRPTGLVGRNGVGKTALAKLITGQLRPSAGRIDVAGRVAYLTQMIAPTGYRDVADLAGVRPQLAALARIESGECNAADFETLGERWDIRERLREQLARHRLDHLQPDTPAQQLSGGECTRVALMGAWLSEPQLLILDEPTNHLDAHSRRALREQLAQWRGGLLVISHDRALLETMERIVELSPTGCGDYGGNYSFYVECRQREREAAQAQLDHVRNERRRFEAELREQRERQQRRQARGNKNAAQANQAKILLGRQRQRSEDSAARLQRQQEQAREQHSAQVAEAAQGVAAETSIALQGAAGELPAHKVAARLEAVELPFGPPGSRHIDLLVAGPQRIAITGPNGCGKSTLLKLLAGRIEPVAGQVTLGAAAGYLDQQLLELDTDQSAVALLAAANANLGEAELRTRLARLGLGAGRALLPARALSGGERMKVALAGMLVAEPPVQWLLLDEPTNHLDLESVEAVEALLQSYRGALVVVSHDEVFLRRLALTRRLRWSAEGWCDEAWSDE